MQLIKCVGADRREYGEEIGIVLAILLREIANKWIKRSPCAGLVGKHCARPLSCNRRQLKKVSDEDHLEAAKGRLGVAHRAANALNALERPSVKHRDFVHDEYLRLSHTLCDALVLGDAVDVFFGEVALDPDATPCVKCHAVHMRRGNAG